MAIIHPAAKSSDLQEFFIDELYVLDRIQPFFCFVKHKYCVDRTYVLKGHKILAAIALHQVHPLIEPIFGTHFLLTLQEVLSVSNITF